MRGPVLVVFDLDGTLIDSRKDLADSANATLGAFGHPPLADDEVARMVGEGARVLLERVFGARGAAPPEAALEVFLRVYDERLLIHTQPYPGVREAVDQLSRTSRLAVLTNKPQRPSERLLAHFALAPFFARVIGGDAQFPRKPDPAGLRYLVTEAASTPADTWLVGDSWIDHETALRAGVRCGLVRYGFGFEQIPPARLRGDEVIIETPAELVDVLRGPLARA